MRDHIFTFPDASTEQKFLEMAEAAGVKTWWIAVDPDSSIHNGEYQFASQETWDDLPRCVQEIINDNIPDEQNTTPWPTTPFEDWTCEDQRKFIFMAVQEFECVGDRLPEKRHVLTAFREGRLPNP